MGRYSSAESGWANIPDTSAFRCPGSLYNFLQRAKYNPAIPFLLFCEDLSNPEKISSAIEAIQQRSNGRKLILVVKHLNRENKIVYWDLLSLGVHDIIEGNDEEDLLRYLQAIAERQTKVEEVLSQPFIKKNLAGESPVWMKFLREVTEISLFSKNASLVLTGESGTGKELISRLIHTLDSRPNKKDLVLLDCTTIVPELSGSEFFGHERGSYTNAIQSREGAFALANNGTLFLDEIGELPLPLQAELLRVIQEGTYKKVGSNTWHKTSFRLVCATHRNLRQYIHENKFRQDLFFRIADFELQVPPLSERADDIPILANHFLRQFFKDQDVPEFDDNVLEFLMNRSYPGNIRELRQLVQRIALKHVNHKKITIGEVPACDRSSGNGHDVTEINNRNEISIRKAILAGISLRDLKNQTMHDAIKAALQITNGNKKLAADKLGVTLRAIQQFLKDRK